MAQDGVMPHDPLVCTHCGYKREKVDAKCPGCTCPECGAEKIPPMGCPKCGLGF